MVEVTKPTKISDCKGETVTLEGEELKKEFDRLAALIKSKMDIVEKLSKDDKLLVYSTGK